MRCKVIDEYSCIFRNISLEISKNMSKYYEFDLFLQIPDLKKIDILEALEILALRLSTFNNAEIDELILESYYFDLWKGLYEKQSSYADDYIAIIGQLFLGGYIDFERCDWLEGEECIPAILSQYHPNNQYEVWKYFRDNYIYELECNSWEFNPTQGEFWDNPNNWNNLNISCIITPKGDTYYKEVLKPKFYNKYKDLEVEIDSKGNVIRWIGQINRANQ